MARSLMLGCAFAVSLIASPVHAQEGAPAKPNLLLREVIAGMPKGDKQEIRVLTATIEPGGKTPFHTHRFPVTVYVLEGAFTLEMEGRAPVLVKAGEAMVEPANVKMTGYNRATEPLKVVIVYVSDPDTPFLDPVSH